MWRYFSMFIITSILKGSHWHWLKSSPKPSQSIYCVLQMAVDLFTDSSVHIDDI